MTESVKLEEIDSKYGGLEGPEAMYVRLLASDGHVFIVKREHALTSGTIKAMLSGPGEITCMILCQQQHLTRNIVLRGKTKICQHFVQL